MIASLRGQIAHRGKEHIVLEVGGVGFLVHIPKSLLGELAGQEGEVQLYTYLHVREGELSLYGFARPQDLAFFRLLLGVSGIGPRTALNILARSSLGELQRAIVQADLEALIRIPGIGRKSAERLVMGLKGKLAELAPALPEARHPQDADVMEALLSLGYSRQEAEAALRAIPTIEASLEERIRQALQYIASRR